jgi:hypothetical protein
MPSIEEATSVPQSKSPSPEDERQVVESMEQKVRVPDLTPERLETLTAFPIFGTDETPEPGSSGTILLNLGGLLAEESFSFTDNNSIEWTWAVTRAREYAASIRDVALFTYSQYGIDEAMVVQQYPSLDKNYAMTTDLSIPVLLVLFQSKLLCIDGWHRLVRPDSWASIPA